MSMIAKLCVAVLLADAIYLVPNAVFDTDSPATMKDKVEVAILQGRFDDRNVPQEIDGCLSGATPWTCFMKMKDADALNPMKSGHKRTTAFAGIQDAKTVLTFCTLPRKVDCADVMAANGYSNSDLQVALVSLK